MAGPFNIAIKAVLKQLGKGSARAVPEDIMSGTVRRIKQEASLHETPRRVLGKELDEYTGPHSDFKRETGLESIGETEIKSFKDKYLRGDDKTRYRSSRLEEQARALDEGVITLDEFKEIRDVIKPLKTYGTVPPLNKQVDEAGELISPDKFDPIEIVGPIGKTRVDNSGIIGFNKFIKEGERATSRFDIDAYNHYDRYIPVIQTLVDKVTKATGKITKKFAKKGYSPTAVLTNVTFNYDPKKAFSIAKGIRGVSSEGKEYPLGKGIKLKKGDKKLGEKEPFATMEGNWKNLTPEEAHRYAKEKIGTEGWTEVGFDPAARQSFYNRATGEPVFKADEVIQVGAMLLARGLRKATPKQLENLKITTKAGKEITYKHGGKIMAGGLSGIKKSININGQPHSLAWINPDEASALKAMGGSGKPGPMGIPSYEEEDPVGGEMTYSNLTGSATTSGNTSYADLSDFTDTEDWYDTWQPERAEIIGSSGTGPGRADPRQFYDKQIREDLAAGRDPRTITKDQNLMERAIGYLTGGSSDKQVTEKQSDLMNRAKIAAYGTWRATTAGRDSLDPEKDFNEWFAQQDPNTLLAGSKVGDPFGHVTKVSMNIVNQQLINRAKENLQKSLEGVMDLSDVDREKYGRKSMIDAAKSGKIEHLKDFTEKRELPAAMQFSFLGQLMKLASRTVIGTGTVGGIPVHVHENGDVTAISPEDSPGFDHESMRGENVVPIKRKRLPPVAQPATLEPEKELTGMEKYYADLPKTATRTASNKPLSDILDRIYGEGQGQQLLG